MNDLEESIARVIAGPERKSRMISEKEKLTIAFHEMGHALVGTTLEHTDPVHKVTIVSRGQALGWTMSLPIEDRYLVSKAELVDQLAQILGGRCAEDLILGEDNITTGASDDIRKATNLARKMVTEWGMSDKLGPLTFGERPEMVFLGRDLGEQRNYSEGIASEIDQEVHQLVADAFQRAKKVLREREHVLRALAARLVEVETMDAPEMERIIDEAESRNGTAPPVNGSAAGPRAPPAPPDDRSSRRGSSRSVGVHSSRPARVAVDGFTRPGDACRASRPLPPPATADEPAFAKRLDPGGPRRGGSSNADARDRRSRPSRFRACHRGARGRIPRRGGREPSRRGRPQSRGNGERQRRCDAARGGDGRRPDPARRP